MKNNLYIRIITGLLFLPIFYLVAWQLPPSYFTALVMAAAAVGQHEFYRMAHARGFHPNKVLGMVLGAMLVVMGFYHQVASGPAMVLPIAVVTILVMIARLLSPRPVDSAIEDIASTLLGIFYVAMLFAFQVAVRTGLHGKQWLVFLYFVIWASDIGAYSIGIPFGRHRLYEKVSPKKSIEGLIGALVAAAGMAILCRTWFLPPVGMGEAGMLGLALAAIGTIGDLTESLFKRAAGVKDSGGIIPGHGGILDRMDSMLFAAPVLYFYLVIR
jgi:phosphatidate cytidylyltransferase